MAHAEKFLAHMYIDTLMASASRIMASSSAEKEWDKGLEGNMNLF